MTHIGNEERRRRIGVRHRLAPGSKASSLREAAASMVVLHATDPAGLFLEARARMAGSSPAALSAEMYDDRTVFRLWAMRRTLFLAAIDDVPVIHAAASRAASKVAFHLALDGHLGRDRPRGTWISGQFRWSPTERWLPGGIRELTVDAEAERLAAWLGPTRIRWPFPPA